MIESPFFSTEGLTNTSANYIANQAKNFYESLEESLKNLQFYQTTVKIIGSDVEEVISYGTPEVEIEQAINDIAAAKSLIAWLREAINQKEQYLVELSKINFLEFLEQNGFDIIRYPQCEQEMTKQQYLDSLSVKDRQRYYTVQTYASTLGKLVHKEGGLSKARKKLNEVLLNPVKTDTNGRDTLIYKFIPFNSTTQQIDDLFFKLQSQQREYQAEFNNLRNKMEQAITADKIAKNAEYQIKLSKYNAKKEEYESKFVDWLEKRKKEIKDLKIVIPNNLKGIYEKINNLGK